MNVSLAVDKLIALSDRYEWVIEALATIMRDRYEAGFVRACDSLGCTKAEAEKLYKECK